MAFESFIHDPNALLDYQRDWTAWLAASGDDSIVTSTWTVPAGLTVESESNTETTATVWISGGVEGERYEVTNHIITNGGREDDRTFVLKVKQR